MKSMIEEIKNRRSVRAYLPDEVAIDSIKIILEAACWAPSGKNGQPWKFAVIQEDKELKNKISSLSIYKKWIQTAPCLIIVFLDKNLMYDRQKDIMAIGAAIQNLLLVAHELGIGTCWLGEILKNENEIRNLLEVPENLEIMAVITAGYPERKSFASKRREIKESLFMVV